MLIVKTLLLPPALKWALGRWVKDVLKIRDWLPPPKIKAIQRYRPEYLERWSCLLCSQKGDSFVHVDFTCTRGGGNNCKRHVKSIFLLSLNAHNHVDDYSGTLGGVHKVHISTLVTSPKNWVVALSFFLCLSLSKKKRERERRRRKKKKKNERTSWLVSGRHVTQKCQQSLPLLHQWRASSSRHEDYESFEEIPAALFKASGSKVRWRPAGHH